MNYRDWGLCEIHRHYGAARSRLLQRAWVRRSRSTRTPREPHGPSHQRIQHDHGQHTSRTNKPPLKGERRVAEPTSTLSSFLPPLFSLPSPGTSTRNPQKIQLPLIGTEPKRHERDHPSPRRDTTRSVFYKSTSVARCFRVPHRNFPRNFRDPSRNFRGIPEIGRLLCQWASRLRLTGI